MKKECSFSYSLIMQPYSSVYAYRAVFSHSFCKRRENSIFQLYTVPQFFFFSIRCRDLTSHFHFPIVKSSFYSQRQIKYNAFQSRYYLNKKKLVPIAMNSKWNNDMFALILSFIIVFFCVLVRFFS